MSEKIGKARLPSIKDKYEAAVAAEPAREAEKVESNPKRKKKNA